MEYFAGMDVSMDETHNRRRIHVALRTATMSNITWPMIKGRSDRRPAANRPSSTPYAAITVTENSPS